MCNPASFVLTKDQVFWSMKTDSHENIIAEFGLAQDGVRGPNILRVEITPPKMFDYGTPAEQWNFKLDQDLLPPWFDATADEIRARLALVEWIEKRVIREKTKRECRDGIFFAVDNSQVTAWDNSQVTARGNSTVNQWNTNNVQPPQENAVVIDRCCITPKCIVATRK